MAGKSLIRKTGGTKKVAARVRRKVGVRKNVKGTDARPRLCVFRSLKYTYAQLISDEGSGVLASATTRGLEVEGSSRSSKESARLLGSKIAELAKAIKIDSVVFDRNGYRYHGRVAAVADGARESGLQF